MLPALCRKKAVEMKGRGVPASSCFLWFLWPCAEAVGAFFLCVLLVFPKIWLPSEEEEEVSYTAWSPGGFKKSKFLTESYLIHSWFSFLRQGLSSPGTYYAGQAGLKLRALPASAAQVLGLKVCTTIACPFFFLMSIGLHVCMFTMCMLGKGFCPL